MKEVDNDENERHESHETCERMSCKGVEPETNVVDLKCGLQIYGLGYKIDGSGRNGKELSLCETMRQSIFVLMVGLETDMK